MERTYREKEPRRGKKKQKNNKVMMFLLVAFGALAIMLSPIFGIKQIEVTGISKFTEEEICNLGNISMGQNIFALDKNKCEEDIKKSSYVESVAIKMDLPSTLKIEVKERMVRGYVPYMGSYLYIDENANVLDIQAYFTEALPLVKGLDFSSFTLGEKIDAENGQALSVVVTIAQVMTKYELLDMVVELNVSNTQKITAFVNNVEVNLGTIANCDEKIRTMAEIVRQIPENSKGSIDLSDLSKPLVFKYLT